jgi:hypothetical protein
MSERKRSHSAPEQIAPAWNREAIQGRVDLLGKTRLEQIAPDWNREAIQGRVNRAGEPGARSVRLNALQGAEPPGRGGSAQARAKRIRRAETLITSTTRTTRNAAAKASAWALAKGWLMKLQIT